MRYRLVGALRKDSHRNIFQGKWVECLQTHGTELLNAPGVLRTMLLGIIPTEFEDELLSKPYIKTWQEIIQWCKVKTVYKRQKVLAEAARKPGGGKATPKNR